MTLDELLADLDREVLRTWGGSDGSGAADGPLLLGGPPGPEAAEAAGTANPGSLANPASPAHPGNPAYPENIASERCLLVTLQGRRCAVPIGAVVAVNELPPVSAVPFSPPWLRGVARAAGGVVAVVDLARLLAATEPSFAAQEAAAPSPLHRPDGGQAEREILVVVRTSGADLDAGLAVPGIARLVSLAATPRQVGDTGESHDRRRSALIARMAPDPTAGHLPPIPQTPPSLLSPSIRQTPPIPPISPSPPSSLGPLNPQVSVLDIDQLLRRARQGLGA